MVNDIFIAADETTASGDTICWFTSRFSLYSITVQWVHQLLKLLMWELEYISPQVPVLDPDLLNIYITSL